MAHHDSTDGAIELVQVVDPAEGAFSVRLPRGWHHQAHSVRPYGVHRTVVSARSPDGGTFLFAGDPQLPDFMEPQGFPFPGMPVSNPMMQLRPYTPAEPFFVGYLHHRYGQAASFRVVSSSPCPAFEQDLYAEGQRRGMRVHATAVSLSFEFTDASQGVRGRLHGATLSFVGGWTPTLFGILTTDDLDPARWDEILFAINRSYQTDPGWRHQQDQIHAGRMSQIQQDHQRTMAQMQQQHQANMNWIKTSAQAHQERMDALHAAGDAQVAGWRAQQASIDAGHQGFMDGLRSAPAGPAASGADAGHERFLNTIKGEETVLSASGEAYQVEAGHERYFRNRRDGTFIGAGGTVERQDLGARFGVNPDDYEEVRVKR